MKQNTFATSNNTMKVIILLLTISLTVAISFLLAYLWSVRNGQFDDDYSPAHRIFFEDINKPKQKPE